MSRLRRSRPVLAFDALFDLAPVGIVCGGPDGIPLRINGRLGEMLGYTVDELAQLSITDLTHPDDIAKDAALFGELMRGERESYRLEKRYLHRDGHVVYGALDMSIARDDAGAPLCTFAFVRDITTQRAAMAAAQERSRLLAALLESTADFVYIKDGDGRIQACSQSMAHATGHADWRAVIGKHESELVGPDTARRREQEEQPLFDGTAREVDRTEPYTNPDGEPRWIHTRKSAVRDEETGAIVGLVGISRDVTQQRAAQAAKDEALVRRRMAADVFAYASEGIMVTDASGSILDVNPAFAEITGYTREEVVGRNPRILKSGRHPPGFYAALWSELLRADEWTGEVWNRRKDGGTYPERLTISVIRDDAGEIQNFVALFADITRQKQVEADLRHTAQHDPLTGLPNRLLLHDRLEQALHQARRTGRRVAVVYLDLDGFKGVNDTHGHAAGDELLIAIAGALRGSVRPHDTIARIGGDEFVAVLTELEADLDVTPRLERLRLAAAQPQPIRGHHLQLSASLGVSFYPQDPEIDADGLMRQADQAMYIAKQAGRDRVQVYEREANRKLHARQLLLAELGDAIASDALVLRYQPKVNLRTGAVLGIEALVRWPHPERGLLSPAAFIPLTEGHARCAELGEWVITRALRDAQAWRAAGLDVPVSVNISPYHLQQPSFVSRLEALMGPTPGRLELEIVESGGLDDMHAAILTLLGCRALGAQVGIDDFGRGYASLTWLRRLPVDHVKIDQSFVTDMLVDPDDRAILEATMGLAEAFSLGVVAVGVETEALGAALLEMGCEVGQGYAIARPMPADEIAGWAEGWVPPATWRSSRPR